MATSGATHTSIFDRIVCDIDTAENLFAVKQANPCNSRKGACYSSPLGNLAAEPDTPGLQS